MGQFSIKVDFYEIENMRWRNKYKREQLTFLTIYFDIILAGEQRDVFA
jgi:hypothetical protein